MFTPTSFPGGTMASFGENLRREREMRGVTLHEIAASTRINVRFLEALERDDFDEMPGGIFTRSFIRAYAGYLGLDQEAVMAEFQTLSPSEAAEDFGRLGTVKTTAGRRGLHSSLLLGLAFAVLLLSGWALYRYSHRGAELESTGAAKTPIASPGTAVPSSNPATPPVTSADQNPPATGATAPVPPNPVPGESLTASSGAAKPATEPSAGPSDGTGSPGPAAATPSNTASIPVSSPNASPSTARGEGDLVLQVATTERVWLVVRADGKTLLEKTLDPNAAETFRASDSFDVTTGNAQGTILTLNGATQPPLGRHGELKKIHLTRQNLPSAPPQ